MRLAGFELDLVEGELLAGGRPFLELRKQALQVLLVLGERPGRVVTKDELMRRIWPSVVVGEDSLVQAVAEIRRVLGDGEHRLVRTVPRRGYMLVPDAPPVTPPGRTALPPRFVWGALATVAVLGAAAAWVGLPDSGAPSGATPELTPATIPDQASAPLRPQSIVVLPLSDERASADDAWFVDAVTSDLTTLLGQLDSVLVIGPGTARTYKGRTVDTRTVARELAVRYVLRGSTRRDGQRIRLALSLEDGESGGIVWSERLDVDRAALGHSVDDIVGQIARALKVAYWRIEGDRIARMDPDAVGADDLAMRGWGIYMRGVSPDNFRDAQRLFEQSVAQDPASVRGLAGLSLSNSMSVIFGWASDKEAAARRADETLARLEQIDAGKDLTLLAKASILNMRADWQGLLAVGETLVSRYPNEPTSHHHRCSALLRLGRFEESIAACERAIRISPRDSRTAIWHGLTSVDLFMLGRCPLAIERARLAVTGNSKLLGYWLILAASLACDGQRSEGEKVLQEFLARHPDFDASRVPPMWGLGRPPFNEGLTRLTGTLRELGLR